MIIQRKPETKRIIAASLLIGTIYTIGVFELGREIGTVESSDLFRRQLRSRSVVDCGGHAKVLFGHVHMAKTAGTSLNGIMANKFERVCGHKGYSYDAIQDNEEAKLIVASGGTPEPVGRSRVSNPTMNAIGFDDCDYVSHENQYYWWIHHFGDAKFHNIEMKLHVPCRDPIDHLMSQCNYEERNFVKQDVACDAATDEEYFQSVRDCFVYVHERFNNELLSHFDVKCYDYKQQFTGYIELMGKVLENRRFDASDTYVQRETNSPRDKDSECIWKRPDLLEKTRKYLIDNVDYYGFCNKCLGSEDELKFGSKDELKVSAEVIQAHV